ncbi:MAG TPA: anthrone oxygenase family protein [Burkholderiaceae bacterium]|jgi:uncharacterized membrane protein|nr:anthrone oxygenase family protein [Burkholderiaceae bacterium]
MTRMSALEALPTVLMLACALGCALVGGVFFAFSTFVMRALAQLPAAQGISAMQCVNVAVLNRWFLSVFTGTAALCAAAVVWALVRWQGAHAALLVGGGLLYLVGTFLVTVLFHVPRNEALSLLVAEDAQAVEPWQRYVRGWTAWNHVRTASAGGAALAFMLALAR